ncbi:uncharacterized protein METZ01_LOCUS215685 [marine metagenome]|uniref:Uncharacterized protein n=1 Tax=marine metagenome TaxID=408172 RepID=A0A382FLI5_9ZZZZ|tara:strand:+ start:10 stop:216 length:207 start_codon:yes stop_codon:yes gene_type:complete
MEEIFSNLLDNLELLNNQGLQALKEYKQKNSNFNDKQQEVYQKIESNIMNYKITLASDKCIAAHHGLI